ncbi:hypothetical protein G5I_04764 [Acromyrmex echinatior]|uniref:Uncharacterized protein n=1 Tax=Acromyrmex echinatior TaxID=103372 RepID=F4WGI5_ACREC|nr:hypothetical protein G5I_04764 [Acromyrmex echinatior]
MAHLLEDAYWLYEENVSDALFPRTYNPSTDQQAFVEDFRLTAAAGVLKWFIRGTTVAEGILVANSEKRRAIPIAKLEFAIDVARSSSPSRHTRTSMAKKGEQPSDEEWNYFLNNHTRFITESVSIAQKHFFGSARSNILSRTITIHICNTAVQEKYDDEKRRRQQWRQEDPEESASSRSVRDQGWDCEKLNEYLK